MDKEQLAIARLQDAARLSEHRYKKPLMVTYSLIRSRKENRFTTKANLI